MRINPIHLYSGALVLGLLLAFTTIVQPGGAGLPTGAAARVNEDIISNERYSQALTRFENDSREPVSDADAEWVLDRLIDEQLLIQRAAELNLVASSVSVRRAILDELIANLTQSTRANSISDAELQFWFDENQALFQTDPRYAISVFRFADELNAIDANTLILAKETGRALKMPAELLPVRKILDYAGSAVAAQLGNLSVSELSPPFMSNGRWTRVYLMERDDRSTMTFEKNKAAIRFEWQRQQADQALRDYIGKLRKRASIKRRNAKGS